MICDIFVGEDAIFTCSITGEPTPEIRWLVDNQEVAPSERVTITYEEGVCTLKISQATPQDEAVYVVEATNKVGKATVSANLVIIRKCLMYYPVSFVVTGSDLNSEVSVHKQDERN